MRQHVLENAPLEPSRTVFSISMSGCVLSTTTGSFSPATSVICVQTLPSPSLSSPRLVYQPAGMPISHSV